MKEKTKPRWPKVLFRTIFSAVAVIVGVATYLGIYGVPEWLAAEIVDFIDLDEFAIEAGTVKLHPFRGVIARDARVYRKKVIGPPMVEAEQFSIQVDLLALLSGESGLRKVSISGATIRPKLISGPSTSKDKSRDPWRAAMALDLEDCVIHGTTIEKLTCHLGIDSEKTLLNDVSAVLADGGFRGEVRRGRISYNANSGQLNASLETKLDPHLLLALVREYDLTLLDELINRFSFDHGPPRCEVKFWTLCKEGGDLTVDVNFWLKNAKYHDVDILRADGAVKVNVTGTNAWVDVRPLFVVRHEGIGTGGLTVDTTNSLVSFDAASTLNPKALLQMIGILSDGELALLDFKGPANVAGRGEVNYADLTKTRIQANVTGRDLGVGPVTVSDYAFSLNTRGLTNVLDNIRCRFYDGDVAGKAAFYVPGEDGTNARYDVEGSLSKVDFEKFRNAFSEEEKDKDYGGLLSLHRFKLAGVIGKGLGKTARGSGGLWIREGRVFLLPIFGGLTEVMTSYIPGMNFVLNQSDAKTEFVVEDGRISTKKLTIEGSVIRLFAYGDFHLDGNLDYRVQIKLLREKNPIGWILQIPTWILSKFFEFRLKGTIEEPKWTAFSSTKDLLSKIGLRKKKDKKPKKSKEKKPEKAPEVDAEQLPKPTVPVILDVDDSKE